MKIPDWFTSIASVFATIFSWFTPEENKKRLKIKRAQLKAEKEELENHKPFTSREAKRIEKILEEVKKIDIKLENI